MRAVRYDHYGPADVLHVADIPEPQEEGVRILVDRQRVPTGTDLETGWPCFR